MQPLPYIDISDAARIQALMDDERNFGWRAIDSETLDSWTPDLGLTGYPMPSIYRPGAVASSGIASTLRHRFWQAVEGQADHTGWRYIGILIYLAARECAPMQLRLASRDIGIVEPAAHDNRLHLIVIDKPVEFIGEMEVFQLTAPGPGSYRIEHFLLLHEKPHAEPASPEIGEISLRLLPGDKGDWRANLHFVTSRMTGVELGVADEQGATQSQTGSPSRLHSLSVNGLSADQHYQATIATTDPAMPRVTRSLSFITTPPTAPEPRPVVVPLELINPDASDRAGLPLRFGIPLGEGVAHVVNACQLHCAGQVLDAQARAMSHWQDGSIRWLLVDCLTPDALSESPRHMAELHINAAGISASQAQAAPLGQRLHENSALALSDFSFETRLANGMRLSASQVRKLEAATGPADTFAVDHCDAEGMAHLRSRISLERYPGQSFVKLMHRLEVISPALSPAAAGGPLPADCPPALRENIVGDDGEESNLLKLRSFSLRIPFAGIRQVRHGGEAWRLDAEGARGWRLRHDHDLGHEIGGEAREGRADGHIDIAGAAGKLGIGLRRFWQTYPKALALDEGGIQIQLFPERCGRELPGDEEAWHRLYFWLDDEGYRLKAGMALSSEILLDFDGGDAAAFAWLEEAALARPDIDYVNASGALNPIGPRRGSPLPDYDRLTDLGIQSFHEDRQRFRAYGQVNFGDWYGESQWSWGNNEYDPAFCGYIEYLRGGDPGWALWAAEAARHLADVDTVNSSSQPGEVGGQAMHIPGHLGGYLPPLFRSKMRGTSSIPSHTWVEGPALHALLTGDALAHESLLKTRDWLLQRGFFDHYDFKNAREAGWHLIHLCMLAAAFDDPDCLNAASIIVERVLERQAPQGGWERNLGEPHCGCGYPRCRGEAGFMVGVLLSGLRRYHHLSGDAAVADAIVGGARWLIRHTYDEESGYFRYTSCRNRTLGGNYQCTQWVMESLAAAWSISGDAEFEAHLRAGLKTIGMFPARLDHSGLGKALSQQMRYVPAIIAILNDQAWGKRHDRLD